MTIQELLTMKGIDLTRTKLVRHNLSNEDVRQNLERGYIEIYQSIQKPSRFKDCDYVVGFIGEQGTEATFMGCYRITEAVPLLREQLPSDYFFEGGIHEDCVFFKTEKTDILDEFVNRLVVEWGKAALSWCQNGTTEKQILYVRVDTTGLRFVSYDKVILTYSELAAIVNNRKEHKEWEERLSAVAGIYLITDTLTGKHYVGSASGEDGGIWGRWSGYARTKHGGNVQLRKLMEIDENHCRHFQYSILDVFPIKRDKHEILAQEQLYKRKLGSTTFGMNDN